MAAVAIRHLSPTQAVLAGAFPSPSGKPTASDQAGKQWLSAPDGAGLWQLLSDADLPGPA